ncbi:MAG TPA: hypothetical protein VFR76_00880, partial [Verrucomicrobiae bacterium]|nr:hypothetical protein [Verrucomicrobiae bacterium]
HDGTAGNSGGQQAAGGSEKLPAVDRVLERAILVRRILGQRIFGERLHARHLGKRSTANWHHCSAALYDGVMRKQALKIDFLEESLLWKAKGWVKGIQIISGA